MAAVSTTRGYIGKGKIFLVPKTGDATPIEIGNCKALSTSVDTDRKARVDYQNAGGGELDVVERITSVKGEMTVDDFKPTNLAQALRGTVQAQAATAVTNEVQTLFSSSVVLFDYIPSPDVLPVVKAAPSLTWSETTALELGARIVEGNKVFEVTTAGTTKASPKPTFTGTVGATVSDGTVVWTLVAPETLVKDTHYKVTKTGIAALPEYDSLFAGGLRLTINYTKNLQYLIQALTDAGTEYKLVFDGLNEVDSGNPVVVKMHRTKFSPTSGLDLIGDDFGEIKMSFSCLKDESITGAGLSQYMQIAMV